MFYLDGTSPVKVLLGVWPQHSEARKHAHPAMFYLDGTSPVKVLLGAVATTEADGVPEEERIAGAELLRRVVGGHRRGLGAAFGAEQRGKRHASAGTQNHAAKAP